MKNERFTIEVGHAAAIKAGNSVCGDAFHSLRVQGEGRIVLVLADGLGSGIKASVLSTLTAAMVSRFAEALRNPAESAELILKTLPLCSVRGIGYSTFTVLTMKPDGEINIAGHGNPPVIFIRNGEPFVPDYKREALDNIEGIPIELETGNFKAEPFDKLIMMSDGITQAGISSHGSYKAFGLNGVFAFLKEKLHEKPQISAQAIAEKLVETAVNKDGGAPGDDTSCVVVSYRKPRRVMVVTGPPYNKERDKEMAVMASKFDGTKIICGGTTATIISRELGKAVEMDLSTLGLGEPPSSLIEGFDLVTEGTISLSKVLDSLEAGQKCTNTPSGRLQQLLENHDEICFVVGMMVNTAHHDPSLPVELDIRRNIVKRIGRILSDRLLKEVTIDYI